MVITAGVASGAIVARIVDLGGYAVAGLRLADELVSEDSAVSHVALREL